MRHTIDYYVSKLEAFLNNNFPNIFENSLLNNVNIKLLLMIYLFLILSLIIVVLISTWKIFKKNNIPLRVEAKIYFGNSPSVKILKNLLQEG